MNMLTDLKKRGIMCCEDLKGLPSTIEATWPHIDCADLRGAFGVQQLAVQLKEILGEDQRQSQSRLS